MSRSPAIRARVLVLTVVLAFFLTPATGTGLVADSGGPTCRDYLIPVAIQDGGQSEAMVFGQLCYVGPRIPNTVQLLVHGPTPDQMRVAFARAGNTTQGSPVAAFGPLPQAARSPSPSSTPTVRPRIRSYGLSGFLAMPVDASSWGGQ
jgi:hypothetical protein